MIIEFLSNVNIISQIQNNIWNDKIHSATTTFQKLYNYKIESRETEKQTAREVIGIYKSGITDPSRYVAQVEQKKYVKKNPNAKTRLTPPMK